MNFDFRFIYNVLIAQIFSNHQRTQEDSSESSSW